MQVGESFLIFEDVRHIVIHDFRKWSDLSDPTTSPFSNDVYYATSKDSRKKIDSAFEEYFNDDGWIE